MADVDQSEEVETDSTIDQQLDIVVQDEETASVAEEIEWHDQYAPGAVTIQFSVRRRG